MTIKLAALAAPFPAATGKCQGARATCERFALYSRAIQLNPLTEA